MESLDLLNSFILECCILIYYTNSILQPRNKYILSNGGIILGYIILYAVSLWYRPLINVIAFTVINFIIIYVLFKIKLKNAVIQAIILTAVMMLSESILGFIMSIGTADKELLKVSFSARMIYSVLSKMMYFIGIIITKNISALLSKEKGRYGSIEGNLGLICVPLFTIMILVEVTSVIGYVSEVRRIVFVVLSLVGIAANMVVYWMYDRVLLNHQEIQELQKQNYENNLELNYCNMLEDKLQQSRIMRHDIKEHLRVLETYISSDNSKAMEYLKSIDLKNDEIRVVSYTNSKVLNILLSEKQKICINKNIDLKIHAAEIDFGFMKDIDIVSIFSNLLNNAIESCEKSENKIIYFNIYKMNDAYLVIKIENGCDTKPIVNEGLYMTTKSIKEDHGIGLKSIEKALKNYGGDLKIEYSSKDRIFTVIGMIPLV